MRRLRRWLLRIVAVAALAAAVAGLVFVDYPQASAELPEALKEYRAEGLPWLASDIARPTPPARENAAEPLRRAIAALPKKGIGYGPSDTVRYAPVEALHGYDRPLTLAYHAAKYEKLDFGRDWDLGSFVLFPEEAGVKHLVRALTARADLRAKDGDDAGALADLDVALRLADLVAQDHGMIAGLVAASSQMMVSGQARHCLATVAESPERVRRYRDWLAKPAPLLDLHRYLRDEAFFTVTTARNLDRMGVGTSWNPLDDMNPFICHYPFDEPPKPEPTSANVRRDGLPKGMRSRAYLARCLQMWTELSRDTKHMTEPVERIAHGADAILVKFSTPPTASHLFDNVLFPVYVQFGRVNRKILASRSLALAYADALLLHAKTGRWPTSSTVPDPLGDGYLGVRNDNGRFRIWSVGEDGIDGKGRYGDEIPQTESSKDLIAAYPPFPTPSRPRPAPKAFGSLR